MKILFTSNLLDNLEAVKYLDEEGEVKTHGGYARLKTAINENSDENTILVDAGNFTGHNIFSSTFEKATSLSVMKTMGYDAILLGKEEASRGLEPLEKMLNAMETNPNILKGNTKYTSEEDRNVNDYYIVEKGDKKVAIFGVTSNKDLSTLQSEVFDDATSCAKRILSDINSESADVIICLYNGSLNEATELVNGLDGIDVLICSDANEGTVTNVGNTTIVGGHDKGTSLDIIEISDDLVTASTYEVVSDLEANEETQNAIKAAQRSVQSTILSRYGLSYKGDYARLAFDLDAPTMENDNYGIVDLITDSYRDAYEFRETDKVRNTVSITNGESIKGGLYKGSVSVNDIFSLVSDEVGEDSLTGLSLIRVYLSGSDLRGICELDASKLRSDESDRLFFGGMKYDFNENRPLWNMVEEVYVAATKDYYIPIKDKYLYPTVMSTKMYNRLNEIISETEGVSWTPIGVKGEEFPELRTILLRNNDGTLIKEWSSITAYIKKGERDSKSCYILDEAYSSPIQKKNHDQSLNPIKLTKHIKQELLIDLGKKIAYVIGALILIKIAIAILNRFFPKKETTEN